VRRALASAVVLLALVAVPGAAVAQGGGVTGLLVRIEGDVVVGRGESADLVVVVSGDVEVRGRAAAVVVFGGTARLIGAHVGHVAVFRGVVELGRGTVVEGDVWLAWARLSQVPEATVEGAVRRGVAHYGWGWLMVSPLLSVGLAILVVAFGLLMVAAGPRRVLAAGSALTREPLGVLAWALVLFVVVPGVAALAFFTVVGLPASLVVLGVLLPLAGLAGFGVSGLRLGRWLLHSGSARPYGAAALGSVVLLAAGLVPVAGQVLVLLAAALGAGALVRTFGREVEDGGTAQLERVGGAADGAPGGSGPEGEDPSPPGEADRAGNS